MKLEDINTKKKYLRMFETCVLKAMREMSINLLKGNIDLTPAEKDKLKRYKLALRKLADPQTSHTSRRKLVLKQGKKLINQLLPFVLSTINHG